MKLKKVLLAIIPILSVFIVLFQNASLPPSIIRELYIGPENIKELFIDIEPYAKWVPNDLSVGQKIAFWGTAVGCSSGDGSKVTDGPVYITNQHDPNSAEEKLTGLPAGPSPYLRRYWTPAGNDPRCSQAAQFRRGSTFVHVNADPNGGGIGIYTATGLQNGSQNFFQPFGQLGQFGVNAFIEGNFVTVRKSWWRNSQNIIPWVDQDDELRIKAIQNVSTLQFSTSDQQAKQQITMTLLNLKCLEEKRGTCQVQYLFNTALYRPNPHFFTPPPDWFSGGHVWCDAAQGNLCLLEGPVGYFGSTTVDRMTGEPVYRSYGHSTQHQLFGSKNFDIRISFKEFITGLKNGVAQYHKPSAAVSTEEMIAGFGTRWNEPSEWVLLDTSLAHEVYNPTYTLNNAILGGSFSKVQIGSARMPEKWKAPRFFYSEISALASVVGKKDWFNEDDTNVVLQKDGALIRATMNIGANQDLTIKFSRGPNRGIAHIYVDGKYHTLINTHHSVYEMADYNIKVPAGNHWIKIVRSGQTTGTDKYIVIHALKAPRTYHSQILFSNAAVTKTGNQFVESSGSIVLNEVGATAEVAMNIRETGSFTFEGVVGPNRGYVDIFIDGQYHQSLSLHDANYFKKSFKIFANPGNHRVTFKRSGQKGINGGDSAVVLYQVAP